MSNAEEEEEEESEEEESEEEDDKDSSSLEIFFLYCLRGGTPDFLPFMTFLRYFC
jgi:hypothetical protein